MIADQEQNVIVERLYDDTENIIIPPDTSGIGSFFPELMDLDLEIPLPALSPGNPLQSWSIDEETRVDTFMDKPVSPVVKAELYTCHPMTRQTYKTDELEGKIPRYYYKAAKSSYMSAINI